MENEPKERDNANRAAATPQSAPAAAAEAEAAEEIMAEGKEHYLDDATLRQWLEEGRRR